jgi:FMN reductase
MIAVLSASLRADSHSRLLAVEAARVLAAAGTPAEFIDLRDFPLPLCDGEAAYGHAETKRLADRLRAADGLIVATPVYNYDANAALKNAIELTGDAWEDKVVGFLCAAGGMASYMSVMALANSLMLDFRSVIVPRFVYATDRNFANGEIRDADVSRRVAELAQATVRLSAALRPAA